MKYIYNGWVSDANGKELCHKWHGETTAPTLQKAISNFRYQFNIQNNRAPYCKVSFEIKNIKEI